MRVRELDRDSTIFPKTSAFWINIRPSFTVLMTCFSTSFAVKDVTILAAKIGVTKSLRMKISPLDHQCHTSCITFNKLRLTIGARKSDFEKPTEILGSLPRARKREN